jgi:uncharacterized protein (DUF2141 family)
VVVNGAQKGQLYLALFEDASQFPQNASASQGVKLPIDAGVVKHTFKNVKWGTYAIAAYQDLNGNGKLDRNFFGVPTEPYAFSNNPAVKWQEPTFAEAAFDLDRPAASVKIRLKYWKEY